MIRSRGSVPMAENMSAYFATRSARFLVVPPSIFPYLQKYEYLSIPLVPPPLECAVAVYNGVITGCGLAVNPSCTNRWRT
jgi:hypothetical protein